MSLKKNLLSGAAATTLIIGAVGGALIQTSEGKVNKSYKDPVGIWTICNGHTGPEVKAGLVWSDEKCESVFLEDVAKHSTPLVGKTNCINSVPLTNNQRDGLISFIFNVGNAKFCASTMAAKLRAKDYKGAGAEFPKWKYAGGKVLNGLVTRRAKEQELFFSTKPWVPYTSKYNVIKQTVVFL